MTGELLDFFEHLRNRPVEARSRLREEFYGGGFVAGRARETEVLDVGTVAGGQFAPQVIGNGV